MQHSATFDLGMHCLSMSHKKDARLIWVKSFIVGVFIIFVLYCYRMVGHIFTVINVVAV